MQNHIDLSGKRALIIGAGAGVGRAVAIRLAGEGMKVALVDGDAAALMRTAALTGRPLDCLVLPTDITTARGVNDIMHIMEGHFKGLDALVNAAGENAQALCRRAEPLLKASDRPVALEVAPDVESPEAEAERIARVVRGEA